MYRSRNNGEQSRRSHTGDHTFVHITCPGAIVVLAGKFLLPGRFFERVRWRGLRSGLRTRPVLALRDSLKAVLISFGGEPGAVGCIRCLESLPLACVDILTRDVELTERIGKDDHDVWLESIHLYMSAQALDQLHNYAQRPACV